MNAVVRAQRQYQTDAVMSATPERLLTMLYDRLLLDVERAEAAQKAENWPVANDNLQHAQSIIAELMSSLTDDWEGSDGLRAVYAYLTQTLITANVTRDAGLSHECVEIITPLRDAWHAAAASLTATPASANA
ncbi:flagellar export chaperone FliS [Paramicrobacterium agarici]|uniref:flagellar export chaperone FliS n=1 Tax=Paramicrobacterium agarici TaxID=630514 RepID=UPI001154601E|nr:flagellar export chaperone FliS [Microbacterium agarici]TQO23632.1 flagellar protein FliS [Microbacterium agarici]